MVWPKNHAIKTPNKPEIKNRADKAAKGEASATIIRADVKAEDHISEKTNPRIRDLRSILISLKNHPQTPLKRANKKGRPKATLS
jgi:hypothetical protein